MLLITVVLVIPVRVVGKPNQSIPPAPLNPIPAIGEPFEHVM